MRAKINWSPELDAKIVALRLARRTFDQIAQALKIAPTTVQERGRKLGAVKGPAPEAVKVDLRLDRDRRALGPGHPETWGLLNRGLSIEGCVYAPPDGKL